MAISPDKFKVGDRVRVFNTPNSQFHYLIGYITRERHWITSLVNGMYKRKYQYRTDIEHPTVHGKVVFVQQKYLRREYAAPIPGLARLSLLEKEMHK